MKSGISSDDVTEAWKFCHGILPAVSRTFALNIPILPAELRDAVCCAYLLCRIADTIEDSAALTAERRESLYEAMRAIVASEEGTTFATDWADDEPTGYARLVRGAPRVFRAFASLPTTARHALRDCVTEMIDGMQRLGHDNRSSGRVRFVCEQFDDLDTYCHYVAGTVGVMLTRLFASAMAEPAALSTATARELGRRFGLGLQATNIIKDHADDVTRGVCFVPRICVDDAAEDRPILAARRAELVDHALAHLGRAVEFVLLVPPAAEGVRLFCLLALMLAFGTLREAARGVDRIPKVGRSEVGEIMEFSRLHVGNDDRLRRWFADHEGQVRAAMTTKQFEAAATGRAS